MQLFHDTADGEGVPFVPGAGRRGASGGNAHTEGVSSTIRRSTPPATEGVVAARFVVIEIAGVGEVGGEFREGKIDGVGVGVRIGVGVSISGAIQGGKFAIIAASRQAPAGRAEVSHNIAGFHGKVAVAGGGSVPVVHDTVAVPRITDVIGVVRWGKGTVNIVGIEVNAIDTGTIILFAHDIDRGGGRAVRREGERRRVGISIVQRETVEVKAEIFGHPALIISEFGDRVGITVADVFES